VTAFFRGIRMITLSGTILIMNSTLEAAYIGCGAAIVAAIIVGVLTYLKRDNASQSANARGNGQAANASGNGNAINAGGDVHIGDVNTSAAGASTGASAGAGVYRSPNRKYSLTPSPQEIASDVGNHPPLQQGDMAKHYCGLLVHWKVMVNTIKPQPNNFALMLCYVEDPRVAVCFTVSLEQFPQIRIAKHDSKVWVSGEIESYTPFSEIVYLKDVSLNFDEL